MANEDNDAVLFDNRGHHTQGGGTGVANVIAGSLAAAASWHRPA